jgi:hypothetical protein
MSKVFKAVGKAVTGVVKGVVKAVSSVVKAVVNVVSSVVSFIAQPFMGMLGGMGSMPDAASEVQRQQGVLVQTQGSNVNIPIVYGYRKVAGAVTFAETGSTNNRYLYVAYVFTEGLVEGLREVFIDDWMLPVDLTGALNAGNLVTVNRDRYNNRVQLQWYPGVYFNDPTKSPVGPAVKAGIFAESPSFKSSMNFNGLGVMFARYEWKEIKTQEDADNNPFGGNIPQMQVSMLGKRVASLLVDETETVGYDSNLIRYSTNPAEVLLDYLRNPRYGKGIKNDDIDWLSWKRAARKFNQTVQYLSTDSNITGPILTSNHVVDTGQTIMSNVKTMLMGTRSYMPYVQGKYKLKVEDAGNDTDILSGVATIAATFTKDDIIGNITYTGIEKSSKYNVVAVNYVDPDQKFSVQQVIYPESESERQFYIDLDGGRENKLDATFPTLTNYAMAKDMARLLFNKSRRQETCSLTVSSYALDLEPGDNIRINSNILNFGTDPWRIVSFKVNDDMTIELGCVRNPDDIYPHVRVGEEDIVLPTYVPKGSEIYFPASDNGALLGLVPPLNAVFPPAFLETPTHPPATDPNAPTGGGPGGGDPIGGAGPIESPTQPVPPTNTVPVEPPPPPAFKAVLGLKGSRAEPNANGTFNFYTGFTQPSDGLYSYSILWWRYNRYAPWTQVRLDTLPGAGGEIPWTLINQSYGSPEFYVRSFATDGRASSVVLRGIVNFPANVADLNPALVGITQVQAVGVTEGWALPESDVPAVTTYDDNIDFLEIRPILSGGLPQDPRRCKVRLRQIENSFFTTPNSNLRGIRVYYKQQDEVYYNYEDFEFADVANYAAGVLVEFNLARDFGNRGSFGGLDRYTFIVRLRYFDGGNATKQMGPATAGVEILTGVNDFSIFGTNSVVARVGSAVIPAGFTIQTVDQAPPGAIATGAEIVPSISTIFLTSATEANLRWGFNPPGNTRFRGFKIRFREVIPGVNPTFVEKDTGGSVNISTGLILYNLIGGTEFKYNTFYDFVVTAQYNNGSSIVDSDDSLICRVRILQGVHGSTNIMNTVFEWQTRDTKQALGQLTTAFAATPTPVPQKWVKKQVSTGTSTSTAFIQAVSGGVNQWDAVRSGSNYALNTWYRLNFQAPNDTFDSIIIYRRQWDSQGALRSTVGSTARYFGLGPWEKVEVPRTSMTKGADGFYSVNVRGPISASVFESLWEVSGVSQVGRTVFSPFYTGTGQYKDVNKTAGIFPYWGAGNTRINNSTSTKWAEFLFSFKDVGVESGKAIRLRDFFTTQAQTTGFVNEVDGFISGNVSKYDVVDISSFNTFVAGYYRNINEAITAPSLANLNAGPSEVSPNFRTTPNATGFTAPLSIFLVQPTTGETVY